MLEFERITSFLKEFPELGAPYRTKYRRLPMARFPYSIVYSIEPDAVWILAVAHQRRRPDYWKDRGRPKK